MLPFRKKNQIPLNNVLSILTKILMKAFILLIKGLSFIEISSTVHTGKGCKHLPPPPLRKINYRFKRFEIKTLRLLFKTPYEICILHANHKTYRSIPTLKFDVKRVIVCTEVFISQKKIFGKYFYSWRDRKADSKEENFSWPKDF